MQDFDGLAVDDPGPTFDHGYLVFAQQRADAAGQLGDNAIFPAHRFLDIDVRRLHPDAQRRVAGKFKRLGKLVGGVDHCLRRNAADIEASAAKFAAFHQRGRDAQLRSANCGDVTARPAADNQ